MEIVLIYFETLTSENWYFEPVAAFLKVVLSIFCNIDYRSLILIWNFCLEDVPDFIRILKFLVEILNVLWSENIEQKALV